MLWSPSCTKCTKLERRLATPTLWAQEEAGERLTDQDSQGQQETCGPDAQHQLSLMLLFWGLVG